MSGGNHECFATPLTTMLSHGYPAALAASNWYKLMTSAPNPSSRCHAMRRGLTGCVLTESQCLTVTSSESSGRNSSTASRTGGQATR